MTSFDPGAKLTAWIHENQQYINGKWYITALKLAQDKVQASDLASRGWQLSKTADAMVYDRGF